jgi:hypothetical protein
MVWAETIERAIAVIDKAPFLSKQQKRDIFYNNAAHFPHLSKEVLYGTLVLNQVLGCRSR